MIEPPDSITETRVVAAALEALASNNPSAGKRGPEQQGEIDVRPSKMAHVGAPFRAAPSQDSLVRYGSPRPSVTPENSQDSDGTAVLRPYPYFYYRDFSALPDPDPLVPLTSPGRVPNFPAKMHSILSRPDLCDIVAWMPHGRSWRVLKPREFEKNVIPTYFEHAKFSSFIRQANGWGFRRITQGRDRNSYYHEMFLRGLPHLCKMMKRPGVSEKQATDPEHEPDFFKISEEKPVPERAQDDSVLVDCTLQGGPKARMPIYLAGLSSSAAAPTPASNMVQQETHGGVPSMNNFLAAAPAGGGTPATAAASYANAFAHSQRTTAEHYSLNNFQSMMSTTAESQAMSTSSSGAQHQQEGGPQHKSFPPQQQHAIYYMPTGQPTQASSGSTTTVFAPAPAGGPQVISPAYRPVDGSTSPTPFTGNQLAAVMPPAFQGNPAAAAQFAAGFAAAAALSANHDFHSVLGQALASFPSSSNNNSMSTSNNGSQQAGLMQQQPLQVYGASPHQYLQESHQQLSQMRPQAQQPMVQYIAQPQTFR